MSAPQHLILEPQSMAPEAVAGAIERLRCMAPQMRDHLAALARSATGELSRRSGVSRGHIIELFKDGADPRPTIETTVRLAIGLEYPLEVVAHDNRGDDADVPPPRSSATDAAASSGSWTREESSTSIEEPRPERTYRDGFIKGTILGAIGTAVAGALVFLGVRASKGGTR